MWRIDPAPQPGRRQGRHRPAAVQARSAWPSRPMPSWVVCCANAAPGRHRDGKLIRDRPGRRAGSDGQGQRSAATRSRWSPTRRAGLGGDRPGPGRDGSTRSTNHGCGRGPGRWPDWGRGPRPSRSATAGCWLADPGDSVVLRVDPALATGRSARIPGPGAHHLAAGRGRGLGGRAERGRAGARWTRPIQPPSGHRRRSGYLRDLKGLAAGSPPAGRLSGDEGEKTSEQPAIDGGTAGESYDPC